MRGPDAKIPATGTDMKDNNESGTGSSPGDAGKLAAVRRRVGQVRAAFLRGQFGAMSEVERKVAYTGFLLGDVWTRFEEKRMAQRAAGLAFHTALSVVPILVIAVSVAGALGLLDGASDVLIDVFFKALLPVDDEAIRENLDSLVKRASSAYLGSVGLVFFLYTSISLFNEADQLFNDAWDVVRRRPLMNRVFLFWTILTVAPPLVTASVVASSYIQVLVVTQLGAFRFTEVLVPTLFPVFLTGSALLVAMMLLPNTQVRLKPAIVAALLTATVFELGKLGFGYYISQFASVSWFRIYGAIFLVPVLLLWIYVSWLIIALGVLLGASIQNFNESILRQRPSHRRFRDSPGLMAVLEVLLVIGLRQHRGEGSASTVEVSEICRLTRADTGKILEMLEREGAIECVMGVERNERRWVLQQPPEQLEVGELMERCGAFRVDKSLPFGVQQSLGPLSKHLREVLQGQTLEALVQQATEAGDGSAAAIVEKAVGRDALSDDGSDDAEGQEDS